MRLSVFALLLLLALPAHAKGQDVGKTDSEIVRILKQKGILDSNGNYSGGGGISGTIAANQLVYATGASSVAGISAVAAGQVLASNGASSPPAYTRDPSVRNLTLS